MGDTVVLDGDQRIDIEQTVDTRLISADAECIVTILSGGSIRLTIQADADCGLNIAGNGECGIVTEVIPPNYYDTSDANLTSANLLAEKKAYGANGLVEGSMVNHYTCFGLLGTKNGQYTLSEGHVDSVSVAIDSSAVADLIPENLRAGVNVLGVYGSLHIPNITQDGTSKIVSIL